MSNNTINIIKQKATFLNRLSNNEQALFEDINSNQDNLDEVIQQYKPEREFRPVNTLRFLIAKALKKGTVLNRSVIAELKHAIENRDVSVYYDLNVSVKQSLTNYKNSKVGMFPNWRHTFKVLFPFIHNNSENIEVKTLLNRLADEIISANSLENVAKHIVSFQGSQNYGSDFVWLAIIPDTAPSVQYAYQIFLRIDINGLSGGIHKGHNLVKQEYANKDGSYNNFNDYLDNTKLLNEEWKQLNSEINFIFINDEKAFVKTSKKVNVDALTSYFNILDKLKDDIDIQDEEKLVFSIARNRLSFQIGKRICFNVNKNHFDFISYNDLGFKEKENFTGSEEAFLYNSRTTEDVLNNYDDIKSAVEIEIERDNHALAKTYDNSAFRKAVFDKEYRMKYIKGDFFSDRIVLNGQRIFKISMGKDYFTDEDIDKAIKEKLVLVHSQTKPKGRSKISQADIFKDQIREGDFFYLTHSNKSVKLIGTITSLSKPASFNNMFNDGWLERSFEPLIMPIRESSFQGEGKYWTPNTNVTCWEINENEIEEANRVLFKPYFNIEFKNNEMENKFKEFLNLSLSEGTVKTYLSAIRSIEKLAESEGLSIFKIYDVNIVSVFQDFWMKLKKVELYRITNEKHHNRYSSALLKYEEFLESLENDNVKINNNNAPLNQIFYGPPGTGKTYNTILEAAKIITQNPDINYYKALEVFNQNLGDQIEFVTFHQNYSYEDFIQGLRPETENSTELAFNKTDGVFKRIADKAKRNYLAANKEEHVKLDFLEVFENFTEPLIEGSEIEVKMKKVSYFITNISDRSIEFRKASGGTGHSMSIKTLEKMYNEETTGTMQGLRSYYQPLLEVLLDLGQSDEVELVKAKNYVIIIDEINRANISRVFGELITLIEKDKRLGGKIPIRATLPSGDSFIVPLNLYIIGTMNTADKSIALLDIALRRRFEFKAMYPKYELENIIIHKVEFLKSLNDLIVKSRKGHDFTIGHSYFMCDDNETFDFESTINNKVIPLLLEYYMNDEVEVTKILNEALKEENYKIADWPLKIVKND